MTTFVVLAKAEGFQSSTAFSETRRFIGTVEAKTANEAEKIFLTSVPQSGMKVLKVTPISVADHWVVKEIHGIKPVTKQGGEYLVQFEYKTHWQKLSYGNAKAKTRQVATTQGTLF